jgi:hypothetical protein
MRYFLPLQGFLGNICVWNTSCSINTYTCRQLPCMVNNNWQDNTGNPRYMCVCYRFGHSPFCFAVKLKLKLYITWNRLILKLFIEKPFLFSFNTIANCDNILINNLKSLERGYRSTTFFMRGDLQKMYA